MKDLKTPTTKCQRCGFNPDAPADGAHCSFCGRGPNEFKRLIAGPMVFICDECIEICVNALSGLNPEGGQGVGGGGGPYSFGLAI